MWLTCHSQGSGTAIPEATASLGLQRDLVQDHIRDKGHRSDACQHVLSYDGMEQQWEIPAGKLERKEFLRCEWRGKQFWRLVRGARGVFLKVRVQGGRNFEGIFGGQKGRLALRVRGRGTCSSESRAAA